MKKLIIVVLLNLGICISVLHAQQVVSSAGDYYQAGNLSLSWTIGEPVIETFTGSDVILTQGFQQGYLSSNSIEEYLFTGLNLQIYPNPTADDLNLLLKSDNSGILQYHLHDLSGKTISHGLIADDLTKIDMQLYPKGVYLLRIIKKSGEPVQSFRVVKQ